MVPRLRPRLGQAVVDRRAGFTLIELLTVIAIIAILAAVVFPVANTVRVRAQQSQLISNMKSIQAALGIYKQDEHGYPPSLGPVVLGSGGTTLNYGMLYPEWLKDRGAYNSPNLDVDDPNALVVVQIDPKYVSSSVPAGVSDPAHQSGAKMYAWNTMDGRAIKNANGDLTGYVLHYSRYRTLNRNDPDYKRQLGFRNPPEDTVVTWNDTFVNYDDPANPKGDLFVLFLNGTVKKYNIRDKRLDDPSINREYWRLKPY